MENFVFSESLCTYFQVLKREGKNWMKPNAEEISDEKLKRFYKYQHYNFSKEE